jgi:L-alanine-DL-glutamate epimerase-like enolase superfamily enzyme
MAAAPRAERIVVRHLSADLERPFRSGIHRVATMHNVVACVESEGRRGYGYTFGFAEHEARAVFELIAGLAAPLAGAELDRVREHWTDLWARTNFIGHGGAGTMALSTIDTAFWDARARVHGMTLAALLGGGADPRPAYASGGSLDLTVEELVAEGKARRAEGYDGFKIRVGGGPLARDVERVAALRDALGPDFALMVDANQGWDRATAKRALAALAPFGLGWLEEPLDAADVEGLLALRALGEIPIAAGETAYGTEEIRRLLEADAVDLLQPDLMRCGGVTGMLAVGALADLHRVPLSPHLFAETAPHLMAALPTANSVECFPGWFDHLFGPTTVSAGRVEPRTGGGIGVELDPALADAALRRAEFVG